MLFPGQCLQPTEIDMLARVCRTVCVERGVPPDSLAAEWTASRLLTLFLNGLEGEEELLEAQRNRARLVPPDRGGRMSRQPNPNGSQSFARQSSKA